jgi:hypothetical protein
METSGGVPCRIGPGVSPGAGCLPAGARPRETLEAGARKEGLRKHEARSATGLTGPGSADGRVPSEGSVPHVHEQEE